MKEQVKVEVDLLLSAKDGFSKSDLIQLRKVIKDIIRYKLGNGLTTYKREHGDTIEYYFDSKVVNVKVN